MIDRYGYRKTLIVNYAFCIPVIFLMFFAQNKEMLLFGGLLIGLPFGTFACLGEAYASDICPIHLRAYMTGYVNICWNIGRYPLSPVLTPQAASFLPESFTAHRVSRTTGPGGCPMQRNGSGPSP